MSQRPLWRWAAVFASAVLFTACAPSIPIAPTVSAPTQAPPATAPPLATGTPPPAPTAAPTLVLPTPTAMVEARVVELEWPARLRLGDSDVVRLALVPDAEGYEVTTEFPEHTTVTSTVPVPRPGGYDLAAAARLDGIGFLISPAGEQLRGLPLGQAVTWRWTLTPRAPGQQRLALTLLLRWTPSAGGPGSPREVEAYSRSLDVRVVSFMGLTRGQAMRTGMVGLVFGSGLSLAALAFGVRLPRAALRAVRPDPALALELHPDLQLASGERALVRALFRRYGRVIVESEFRSGYSGARTFLALPIRPDGRADAHTIVKLGARDAVRREFENYEAFVKDTLPPMTARIQERPVVLASPLAPEAAGQPVRAALRYTFLAEPGRKPTSLRQALLADPSPALLEKLLETFGPNWWMQRRACAFRLAQEYDRMLPAHYVVEPAENGRGTPLDGRTAPADVSLRVGDAVRLRRFSRIEHRADGRGLSLTGDEPPGQPPLRVRWMSLRPPLGMAGRVIATRQSLLREFAAGLDLYGLPDPLARLTQLLNETVLGTRATIHGDLNLENVLVGPGEFVWLIDFARTREGHPLYDFAHLEAEIIAHVLAPRIPSARDYAAALPTVLERDPLLVALHGIAGRCLFNPTQPREYHLALFMACVGALKFPNLDAHAKHLLYLTAAHLSQTL